MDGKRFDDLSRKLATPRSRRSVFGMLGAAAAGLIVGGAPGGAAPPADKPSKCYGGGSSCTNAKQCCSGICTNRRCEPEFVPECADPAGCPGTDTECQARTCIDGRCGMAFTPAGTPTFTQVAGDCKRSACDGNGNIIAVIDDTDLPVDGNECTQDICMGGVPSNPPVAAGEPCGVDGSQVCNGNGGCGECAPGETQSCYSGPANTADVGVCQSGTQTCGPDGSFGSCVGQVLPGTAMCNGQDNDCDGTIDDSDPRVGEACSTGRLGICGPGTLQCVDHALTCVSNQEPQPETCNGLDDDCDGQTDEGDICPAVANGTSACIDAQCGIGMCNPGFADCNNNPADGCETNTSFDSQNCGGCGRVCPSGPNAYATCSGGVCGLGCATGFFNCNGRPLDGCECPSTYVCQSGPTGPQCCAPPTRPPLAGVDCCPGLDVNPLTGTCM